MSKRADHIDQIIRQKLFDAEVKPSASSWDRLLVDMDKTQSRKVIILFTKRIAVAAVIIILVGLGFVYFTPKKMDHNLANTTSLIDSSKNELQKIKSIALEPKLVLTPKKELTINIKQTRFDSTPETKFRTEFNLAYLKLIDWIYPIVTKDQEPTLIAQNNPNKNEKVYFDWSKYEYSDPKEIDANTKKILKIGLGYSPSYASANASSNNSDNFYANIVGSSDINRSNTNENLLPTFTFGANFSYSLSDKWSLLSGIYYLKQKNEIQNFYVFENTANSETKFSTNSSLGNIQIINNNLIHNEALFDNKIELSTFSNISNYNSDLIQQFEFIEIPLLISYQLINKKWTISLITGFNAGFLVGNSVYMKNFETGNNKVGSTDNLNSIILKSVVGFSFEYPLSKRLFLTLSPSYKYQITNINKVMINNNHFKFIDFKTGISYHF